MVMKWLGIGKEIASPIEAIGNAIDKTFTSEEERLQAQATLQKMAMKPQILQAEINKVEASHRSVFVAGWRPAVGWVCVGGLAWHYVVYEILSFLIKRIFPEVLVPPKGDAAELNALLGGLLGLGAYRTVEKIKGVSK